MFEGWQGLDHCLSVYKERGFLRENFIVLKLLEIIGLVESAKRYFLAYNYSWSKRAIIVVWVGSVICVGS